MPREALDDDAEAGALFAPVWRRGGRASGAAGDLDAQPRAAKSVVVARAHGVHGVPAYTLADGSMHLHHTTYHAIDGTQVRSLTNSNSASGAVVVHVRR